MKKLIVSILIVLMLVPLFGFVIIFVTGDGGTINHYIKGMHKRAFQNKNHIGDKIFLYSLYGSMATVGHFIYPEASHCLFHTLKNNGDTLFIDNTYFKNHPDVMECVRQGKIGIIYGASRKTKKEHPEYLYPDMDYRIMYAFNPLMVKKEDNKITCYYDNYIYAKLDTKISTPFDIGKIHFDLYDGMMHKLHNDNIKGFYCSTSFEIE